MIWVYEAKIFAWIFWDIFEVFEVFLFFFLIFLIFHGYIGESGVVWVRGCLGQWTFECLPQSKKKIFFYPMCVTV